MRKEPKKVLFSLSQAESAFRVIQYQKETVKLTAYSILHNWSNKSLPNSKKVGRNFNNIRLLNQWNTRTWQTSPCRMFNYFYIITDSRERGPGLTFHKRKHRAKSQQIWSIDGMLPGQPFLLTFNLCSISRIWFSDFFPLFPEGSQ